MYCAEMVLAPFSRNVMGLIAICPVLGIIAMAMSLSHLLPLATSIVLRDGTTLVFAGSMALNFAAGCAAWLVTRHRRRELQLREGMVLIALGAGGI